MNDQDFLGFQDDWDSDPDPSPEMSYLGVPNHRRLARPQSDSDDFSLHSLRLSVNNLALDSSRDINTPPTESEIREALSKHGKSCFCFGLMAAKEFKIIMKLVMPAYMYELETFTEERSKAYETQPYTGQPIDSSQDGKTPNMWAVSAVPIKRFENSLRKVEIPYTASVTVCQNCKGNGNVTCSGCGGSGYTKCSNCGGSASTLRSVTNSDGVSHSTLEENCSMCIGGNNSCLLCSSGKVKCPTCSGHQKVKNFQLLIVVWKNFLEKYVTLRGEMPLNLLDQIEGVTIIKECSKGSKPKPLLSFADPAVRKASSSMIENQIVLQSTNRKVKEFRQTVTAFALTEVTFRYNNHEDVFYVYGNDNCIYFPNKYPANCFCCSSSCTVA